MSLKPSRFSPPTFEMSVKELGRKCKQKQKKLAKNAQKKLKQDL